MTNTIFLKSCFIYTHNTLKPSLFSEPPPSPCGHFAPAYNFVVGHSGSFGDCKKDGKNFVCPVTCDNAEFEPTMNQVVCKAAKKGKFAFFPSKGSIKCES